MLYFDIYCRSYKIISLGTKRLLKTQLFEEKCKLSSEEKILASFFLVLSDMANVREQLLRAQNVYWLFCANDRIFFWGPKRSIETNNSKNSCFHGNKSFWPFFPRIIECDKPQGTIYGGSYGVSTITVEVIRSFLQDLWRCWKHFFPKKDYLPDEQTDLFVFASPSVADPS